MLTELIDKLGYDGNPNFLRGAELERAGDYSHIFRRARELIGLQGVYVLRQPSPANNDLKSLVPVVYVCKAADNDEAMECRRLAWNQNAAPFLIVATRSKVRLFSTFNYDKVDRPTRSGLDRSVALDEIAQALSAFTDSSIDNGTIWREYGQFVTPKQRVDWSLLDSLEKLDKALIDEGLEWHTSHALIGKYVYLWYLRQRDILSDRRFGEWNLDPEEVFGRDARRDTVVSLLEKLDGWLNGSVFPLHWTHGSAPSQKHVRKVAAVFRGDDLNGQLHLPFDAYDFSVIPVETLSSIYEQFLHAHEPAGERPRGKELGAYYTPVPLVNFMLDELEDRRPLKKGMTCFDASCGSGAFLVQCYRRLIENRINEDGEAIRRPAELRDLLKEHIFGMDRDGDACRVTELSLILTLLDYVRPPDLLPVHKFKLPDLHNSNIFEADFFDPDSLWMKTTPDDHRRYDWVVGNPPWVELKPPKSDDQEPAKEKNRHARKWIADNKTKKPAGGDQLAEAFLWKVAENLKPDGVAAMLVPAMTLFKSESTTMRQEFFRQLCVWCVANFANLAYVLFAGRAETPAAAIFYTANPDIQNGDHPPVLCYSPLVATQEANRPERGGKKTDTWNIIVNASEVSEVAWDDAVTGDSVVWKTSMWGSRLDLGLLRAVSARCERLEAIRRRLGLEMNQGVELRSRGTFVPELVGEYKIDTQTFRGCRRIYSFSQNSLAKIKREEAHLREGRDDFPMRVSRPPHIIVDSARRFAVYSDAFLAVPARMIGIAGRLEQAELLKALSLFFVSDFAIYHQFLTSPQFGVRTSIADLDTLKKLPIPIDGIQRGGLARWSRLHAALVAAGDSAKREEAPLYETTKSAKEILNLEAELNEMVNDAMALRRQDVWQIEELAHVRMTLIKGKIDLAATRPASSDQMLAYAQVLREELDSFIEVVTDERHTVEICHERESAMIVVHRGPDLPSHDSIRLLPANSSEAASLRKIRQKLLKKHSQWLYFERALTRYSNGTTYLFKPMQRLHWLRSQALVDASEIIADRAGGRGS